jgi:uncharacterized protein YggE
MKKSIIILLALFMFVITGVSSASYSAEQGYISVEATSELELVPDVIDFSVEVVTTSKDSMAKAVEENKKVCAKVYEGLKKSIEKNPTDSIKTSNYSANPVYRYNNNKRVLDYYQVRNSIKVHTKDVTNVGKMIDTATENGATSVNNLSYSISKNDEESSKLLAETAKKARLQGENIAKAMGTEITGIRSISSSCSFSSHNMMPRLMMMSKSVNSADGAVAESNTSIEVGTMTLHARVNADFYVK